MLLLPILIFKFPKIIYQTTVNELRLSGKYNMKSRIISYKSLCSVEQRQITITILLESTIDKRNVE